MNDDRGSAPVEFALVSIVVLALFLGVLQLGFALHVRNTLTAAAADGARHGAAAGRDPSDAVVRTRVLVKGALSESFADDVVASEELVDGVPTVVVDVRTSLPVIGPWGPAGSLHVRAHALEEDR